MKVSMSEILTIVNLVGVIGAVIWGHAKAILPMRSQLEQLEKDNTILMHENKEQKDEINLLKVRNSEFMVKIDHLTELVQEIKQGLKHDRR